MALTKFSSALNDGQIVGAVFTGVICVEKFDVTWGEIRPRLTNLQAVFGEELKAAGFAVEANPGDLFAEKESAGGDLEVGALIKSVDDSGCADIVKYRETLKIDLHWQVYSNLQRAVVATIDTHGMATRTKRPAAGGGMRTLAQEAFADNVRALLSDERFRQVVTAKDADATPTSGLAAGRERIHLVGAVSGPMPMGDAVGSVASIFAGDGFGSGVLVSSDGYMLTAQHVVGTAPRVRVRWSDGFETTGEVIRTDKRRDVALVKTEPHGRLPLAIRRTPLAVGSTVFAIGTPLDPRFQSTVTRGIVSANRIVDGFAFIQSDVPVNHGNSGGPLLDESGAIVGLTDWGLQPAGDNSHNFFVPVGDALDFLSIDAASPAQPPPRAAASPPLRRRPADRGGSTSR